MAELDTRIETYTKSAEQYRNTAESHKSLATSAKERGAPSTRHVADSNAARAQAAQFDQQVAAMREEYKKLNVELEYATQQK